MDIENIRGALARGYCAEGQPHKVMDPDLCEVQAVELMALLEPDESASLFPLRDKIATALNQHSAENGSDTPDHLLADYLLDCLGVWDTHVSAREVWYGRQADPINTTST